MRRLILDNTVMISKRSWGKKSAFLPGSQHRIVWREGYIPLEAVDLRTVVHCLSTHSRMASSFPCDHYSLSLPWYWCWVTKSVSKESRGGLFQVLNTVGFSQEEPYGSQGIEILLLKWGSKSASYRNSNVLLFKMLDLVSFMWVTSWPENLRNSLSSPLDPCSQTFTGHWATFVRLQDVTVTDQPWA